MTTQTNPTNPTEKSTQELRTRPRDVSALAPWDEMDRLFDTFFPRDFMRMGRMAWPGLAGRTDIKMPAIDVIDREDQIVVRAEVPGIKKDDIEVSVTDNTVTIRGASRREEKKEEGEYYRREINCGEFVRTLNLPCDVEASKAKATFNDGMLELTLPKMAPAKRRTIKVE